MTMNNRIKIIGNKTLQGGQIEVSGSSNQVTKCIIASLLTDEKVTIKNAPLVDERLNVEALVKLLGASVATLDDDTIVVNAQGLNRSDIPEEICKQNRISILTVGPLLHRFKKARIYGALGGDQIGKRPVNFHLDALEKMGAIVEQDGSYFDISVGDQGLTGAHIVLPFPSVMTTENILITAAKADGRTIIENAAVEPEVFELAKMLQKMGADIRFTPNRTILIQGRPKLKGCELRCMIDRNQAVSFALAALATGGNVLLKKVTHESVFSFINFIQGMGASFKINSEGLYVEAPNKGTFKSAHIEVDVHPGFMTDWQQPFMVLFTQATGTSILHETVFENRLGYTEFLNDMGAKINLTNACLGETPCRFKNRNFNHSAIIHGPTPLVGRDFTLPTDIRAGKCLVIAGLVASGTTNLENVKELSRKYDNLVPKLQQMGADISVV